MTLLEFIRKNSILVIVVIFVVGAGLVMMDYSGKASAFSRNFCIKVNGTGYSDAEAYTLGENGKEFLSSLVQATRRHTDRFDADEDGQLNEQEAAALEAWEQEHPEIIASFNQLHSIYNAWCYGPSGKSEINVAITRAMLHAEADLLGIHPSEEQIDNYLRLLPAFHKEDGSFNTELYQRLAGYRKGNANRVQEENFRGVVADMIIWESLQSIISSGVSFNTKAQLAQIDSFTQQVSGRTAWLPTEAVPTPEEPTEDELKAYWEEHKDNYKSEERRIVSVYTLSPDKDSNMESLLTMTDQLMQDLSQANGQGLDKLLTDAANNEEIEPFHYLMEDGNTHRTYPLSTQSELKELLRDEVNYDGHDTPLADVVFAEVPAAPKVADYEAAVESGNAEKHVSIKLIRGPYTTKDDKVKLLRIEAIETPGVLPYEEARNRALVDFRAERANNALVTAAERLYREMEKTISEQGMPAAFALAAESGAQVENYGPVSITMATATLPSGVTDADVLSTHSGKLTPLALLPNGARITSVDRRTVEDSQAISMQKRLYRLPVENMYLRRSIMQDWLNSAYGRFDVQTSPSVQRQTED